MSFVLLLLVLLPLAGGLVAAATESTRAARVATMLTSAAFALAGVLTAAVLLDGPVAAVLERADGRAIGGLYADRLSVVLALLICAVSGIVQAFAQRYLRADPRAGRFFAATGLLTAATLALVTSATLVGLAVAWSLAGLALLLLLGLYAELPAAREGVRRTARAFALGDLALWAAVVLALITWGNLDLRGLGAQLPRIADDELPLALVACGLVIAALARSAQLPFGRWLPATLAAPTPVSALLHAGVVNAGGVLLVRLAPLFGASSLATHLAFAAGAVTAIYGTSLMLVKPDVKGGLAHSTMGQMGFMIMVCGLGAFAAVIFHLVAHGMYKATLFLGSGSAVGGHVRLTKAPPVDRPSGRALVPPAAVAMLVPALAVTAAALLMHPELDGQAGAQALLVFAWASAAWASWGWLQRQPSLSGMLVAGGASVLGLFAYVAALRLAGDLLDPAVAGAATAVVDPLWLALPLAAFLLAALARAGVASARLEGLRATLYVLALSAADTASRGRPRPARASRPSAPVLRVQTSGASS